MPRMREAIRSGWKTSKSVSFSPVEANMIGWPVTCRTESAAPPRASPSSLVRTTPVKPTPSWNAVAVVTASWPIIASTTNSVSSGWTASRMPAAWAISSASMPSRPAVSTTTTSCIVRRACSMESRATRIGSPTPLPGSGAKTSTPAWPPTTVELLHRVRALQVGRDEQRGVPLRLEPAAELAGQGRLTGTLQTGQHDHRRRLLGQPDPAGLAAEDLDELLVDDLDDLLRRVQRLRRRPRRGRAP